MKVLYTSKYNYIVVTNMNCIPVEKMTIKEIRGYLDSMWNDDTVEQSWERYNQLKREYESRTGQTYCPN